MTTPSYDADVIIVGGGFAGVTAARELTQNGASVIVLEARDRLGGRTWTKPSELGRDLEIGGTWVHWIQPHVWAEIVRYDLEIVSSPDPEKAYWVSEGTVKEGTPDDLFGLLEEGMNLTTANAMSYFPNPHLLDTTSPKLKAVDEISIRTKLDELSLSAEQTELLDGMWALNFNGHPENSAWTQGLRWAALAGGSWQLLFEACAYYKLATGTKGLLEAIAGDAASADFRLGVAVIRVEHSEMGAEVALADDSVLRARHVIVTLPLNVLNDIEFSPPLHPTKAAASAEGQASTGVKFWARVKGELPNFVALSSGAYPLNYAQAEYRVDGDTIVVGFGPDATKIDITDRAAVEAGLRQWLPDIEVVAIETHDWVHDTYSQQTWPMLRPGQLTGALAELQRPEGTVRLAGSDYAEGWAGFIDGAIESAKRTARRVLNELSRTSNPQKGPTMSTFVEFVSYNAPGVPEDKLMDLRREAIVAVKAAHPALVDVPAIMRTGDESYVDIWIYESQEAAEAANTGAAEIGPFMAFMAVLTDIEFQTGTMADSAGSPLRN